MDLSALTHRESSRIAQNQREIAMEAGENIVVDTVLPNLTIAKMLVKELEGKGYSIHLIDVEASFEVCSARITDRWVKACQEAIKSADGLGGRWVPSEYVRGLFNDDGTSVSEGIAKTIAESSSAVMQYQVFRTPELDKDPILELDVSRKGRGKALR